MVQRKKGKNKLFRKKKKLSKRKNETIKNSNVHRIDNEKYKNYKNYNKDYIVEADEKNDKVIKIQKKGNYKILTIAVFGVLFVYLLGYIVAFVSRPSVGIEVVEYGSIDVPTELDGIIVREEVLVESEFEGQPIYNFTEGSKISNNDIVCTFKTGEDIELIEAEIERISEDITEIQGKRTEFSIYKEEIDRINEDVSFAVDENLSEFAIYNVEDMYSLKSEIEGLVGLRNQIWLAENNDSTAGLVGEMGIYQSRLDENVQRVKADGSGLFALTYDNLEESLTPENLGTITQEQIKMNVEPSYISKSSQVVEGSPIFRFVTSNIWYIASYIPNEIAGDWEVGDYVELHIKTEDSEKSINFQVHTIEESEEEKYVVFSTDKYVLDFIDNRNVLFTVDESSYNGFKIPNEAIVERTFIKIPKVVTTDSGGDMGVIKRTEEGDNFFKLIVSQSDEENYYVLQDFGTLKLGDVLIPIGQNAEPYTLNEIVSYKGVYVANSSITDFTVVEIIGENNEYTIVNPNSQYGLKVYDRIVSDVRNINEDEIIN